MYQSGEYGSELAPGLYSYAPSNANVRVVVDDGPLMTEITQVFTDNVVLKTRVFKPKQRCAYSHLLQQVVLLDRLNVTDEVTLHVASNIENGGKVEIDEGGSGEAEVIANSLTYGRLPEIEG